MILLSTLPPEGFLILFLIAALFISQAFGQGDDKPVKKKIKKRKKALKKSTPNKRNKRA